MAVGIVVVSDLVCSLCCEICNAIAVFNLKANPIKMKMEADISFLSVLNVDAFAVSNSM